MAVLGIAAAKSRNFVVQLLILSTSVACYIGLSFLINIGKGPISISEVVIPIFFAPISDRGILYQNIKIGNIKL